MPWWFRAMFLGLGVMITALAREAPGWQEGMLMLCGFGLLGFYVWLDSDAPD